MRSSAARRSGPPGVESLNTYLKEISVYPLLGRSEEIELAQRIHAGDARALDKLVCSNLRFVVAVAKRYQHQGVSLEDLINDGNIGLMHAASRFDESRGIKFISYAVWWVRQSIVKSLAQQSRVVRVPLARVGALYGVAKGARVLQQGLGRDPTNGEIAAELRVPEADVEEAARLSRRPLSLDAPISGDTDTRLLDYIADETAEAPDEPMLSDALAEAIERALSGLRPREAMVLRRYFGLDGEPATLDEIGRGLGITRERVRQIKDKGLSRLRNGREGSVLAALAP